MGFSECGSCGTCAACRNPDSREAREKREREIVEEDAIKTRWSGGGGGAVEERTSAPSPPARSGREDEERKAAHRPGFGAVARAQRRAERARRALQLEAEQATALHRQQQAEREAQAAAHRTEMQQHQAEADAREAEEEARQQQRQREAEATAQLAAIEAAHRDGFEGSFDGRVVPGSFGSLGTCCVAAFPAGLCREDWDDVKSMAEHGRLSTSAVYICSRDPRHGSHEHDPATADDCYCMKLFGARQSFGCQWFAKMFCANVERAVQAGQTLVVFYTEGHLARCNAQGSRYPEMRTIEGEVDWEDLPGAVDVVAASRANTRAAAQAAEADVPVVRPKPPNPLCGPAV